MKQLRRSVPLDKEQWKQLKKIHLKDGYFATHQAMKLDKGTYYNILTKGRGREDMIDKVVKYLDKVCNQ